jgi:hypothetical protein
MTYCSWVAPMWDRLQRFSALDRDARRLFLRASMVLPLISLSLLLRGFKATQVALRRFLPLANGSIEGAVHAEADQVSRTARMVRAAAHYGIGDPTCLEKSLALWWLLGRQGIPSALRIGTRLNAGRFEAHAWVECDGAVLNEPDEPHRHYAAFQGSFSALPPTAA